MSDLNNLFRAQDQVTRWSAERENASARLELAKIQRNIAHLISQHEPVNSLDRERLRIALHYVEHGDEKRLAREFEALLQGRTP